MAGHRAARRDAAVTRSVATAAALALAVGALAAASAGAFGVAPTAPSVAPTIFAMSLHIGWEADRATGGKVCSVASGHECQSHRSSTQAGGFEYPSGVATDPRTGKLYVADRANYRVQELSATGTFILMFGGGVNATQDARPGASRAQRDVCAASSGDRCRAGALGGAVGELSYPVSVAVDPTSGDVYVLENGPGDNRLDKYTSAGRFVWMVGKGVNRSTGGNFCSAREIKRYRLRCGSGAENSTHGAAAGAFRSAPQSGNLVAAGGPERLVYVGDEYRVQEFDSEGRWKREIPLVSLSAARTSAVGSLAVDENGGLYLVYKTVSSAGEALLERADVVRRLSPAGEQVGEFAVVPRLAGAEAHIDGVATDPSGRVLATIGVEVGAGFYKRFGLVYDGVSGRPIGEFPPPRDNDGLTLDGRGDLYVAATDDQEVVAYAPASAAQLATAPVACEVALPRAVTAFSCAMDGAGAPWQEA